MDYYYDGSGVLKRPTTPTTLITPMYHGAVVHNTLFACLLWTTNPFRQSTVYLETYDGKGGTAFHQSHIPAPSDPS